MRVLLINSVCGRQSTGRIVSDLKKTLTKNGNECRVAYGEKNSIADVDDYHIGFEISRYTHAVYARLFDASGFGSKIATKRFLSWVENYDPDIIHLHNIHGYYLNIKLLFNFLRNSGKKIVWTLHDCWAFTGHCAYFDYVNCSKWKKGCYCCPQKREYPTSLLLDRSKTNYEIKKNLFSGIDNLTLVTPSIWLSDLISKSFLKNYKKAVINNGIDTETFYPRQDYPVIVEHFNNKKILLGVAAVWDRRKGLNFFLDLASKLSDDFQIMLVGLTEKQIRSLPSNVIGISHTDSKEQLACLYSSAFAFLNPTLEDNYPTTNIEAIACGTPVIAFQTGGCPEVVTERTGAIVRKGDIDGMLKQINELTVDREECSRIGKSYGSESRYAEYINLYHEILV